MKNKGMFYRSYGKRILDVVISLIVIILVFPIILLSFLLVFMSDGRPFLYQQTRIGKDNKPFELYKLRTMIVGSDKGSSTTVKEDSRIISGGYMLRASKIDELPQLFNVLKGDMSLIGPRPTVIEDHNKMDFRQRQRHIVYPGLTGLAQISGGVSLSWPERIELDLQYINKLSFYNDAKIFVLTILKIITNDISSDPPSSGEWS